MHELSLWRVDGGGGQAGLPLVSIEHELSSVSRPKSGARRSTKAAHQLAAWLSPWPTPGQACAGVTVRLERQGDSEHEDPHPIGHRLSPLRRRRPLWAEAPHWGQVWQWGEGT